jgi:hypothetical protein
MSENEIFEIPPDNKLKKTRKKRELTEEQKDVLRERLKKAREARKLKSSSKTKIKNNNKVNSNSERIKVNNLENKETPSEIETIIESDSENNTTVEAETEIDLNDIDTTDKDIMNLQLDIDEMNEKLNKKKKRSANAKKGVIIRQRQNIDSIVEKKVNEKLAKLNSIVQDEVKRRKAPPKNHNKVINDSKGIKAPVVAPKVAPKVEPPKPKPKPVSVGLNTPFWAL